MDIDQYLERIGLERAPSATEDGLAALIEAHILSVPFENLDIALGHGIHLETDYLFGKIVRRRRGGYCFELNGLFGELLDALGFDRHPMLARVWFRGPAEVPGQTHTFNLVNIGGRAFMVDVGFGGTTARLPVPLEDGARVSDVDGEVTVRRDGEYGFMLTRHMPEGPEDQFSTTGTRAHPSDLVISNHFMATHPASHFTKMAVAGRFTPEGRTGLVDCKLTVRNGWQMTDETVTSSAELRTTLRDHFGLDLGEEHEQLFDAVTRRGITDDGL